MALVLTGPLPKIGHWAAQTSAKSEMAHGSGSKFNNPVTPELDVLWKMTILTWILTHHHTIDDTSCLAPATGNCRFRFVNVFVLWWCSQPLHLDPLRAFWGSVNLWYIQGTALFNFQMFPDFWKRQKRSTVPGNDIFFVAPLAVLIFTYLHYFAFIVIYSHLHQSYSTDKHIFSIFQLQLIYTTAWVTT